MNLTYLAAFVSFAATAFAATPGSIAPLTFQLTLHAEQAETEKTLKNGNTEFAFPVVKYAINNKLILAEAQRLGLLSAGKLDGWQIVGAFDRDGEFLSAHAYHKKFNQAVELPFFSVSKSQGGSAQIGKVQRTASDDLISGSLSFTESVVVTIEIDDIEITGVGAYTGKLSLKKIPFGGVQWVNSAFGNGTFVGFTDEEQPVHGKLMVGASTQVADLETLFLPR